MIFLLIVSSIISLENFFDAIEDKFDIFPALIKGLEGVHHL